MKKLVFFLMLVLFSSMAFAESPLRLTTGGSKGVYFNVAAPHIVKWVGNGFKIEVMNSKGSLENIQRIKNGEADAAIVQYDALVTDGKNLDVTMVAALYDEYVQLITLKDGPKSIKDFKPGMKIAMGSTGSGSHVTWTSFCTEDESYKEIVPDALPADARAFSALESGNIDGIIVVGGLGYPAIANAASRGIFKISAVDDYDFNDTLYKGKKVYNFVNIDTSVYPGIANGFFSSKVETISVPAVLIVSNAWIEENPDSFDILYNAVTKAIQGIKATQNQ